MSKSTNTDWWNFEGTPQIKATINYEGGQTLEVTDKDYIVEFEIKQDLSSSNERPTFNLVSDELTLTLLSLDNEFNPFREGEHKITLGCKIDFYVGLEGFDWEKINSFKVVEVSPDEEGYLVKVLAKDFGNDIETNRQRVVATTRDVVTSQDIEDFFDDVFPEYDVIISGIPVGYPLKLFPFETRLEVLDEFLGATFTFARCTEGLISIKSLKAGSPNATLRDDYNIITLTPGLSLSNRYSYSIVAWNEISLKKGADAFTVDLVFPAASTQEFKNIVSPVFIDALEEAVFNSDDGLVVNEILITEVYSNLLTVKVTSTGKGEGKVQVKVTALEFNEVGAKEANVAEKTFSFSNKYVQTKEHADKLKLKFDKFISLQKQYVASEILFTPHLKLGDIVEVDSTRYGVNMTGYIVEQTLSFTSGEYHHEITLLNTEAI
jgi:hypothetical protein